MSADLHIHTAYSLDGEVSPGWVVDRCIAKDIRVFTVTDHNTVSGAREVAAILAGGDRKGRDTVDTDALPRLGMAGYRRCFIPGVELDCMYGDVHLHLLGFGIDTSARDFYTMEREVNRISCEASGAMIDNLVGLGFPVDRQEVLRAAGDREPTPELIIDTMLKEDNRGCPLLEPYFPGGARSGMPHFNFYFDWFAQGCPAYVHCEYMQFRDAVALICDNGGVPIVAHPGQNFRGRERMVEKLLNEGAAGLECFNNYHTDDRAAFFADIVVRNGALMTCGSDFHGKVKPLIGLGEYGAPGSYADYLDRSVRRLTAALSSVII
ncbi:MAG: PHP domain-containing protein [Rikenellaceae bacterium]|nr:PHP domain-containing protein [Rikenellaceae bacterium]